MKEISWITNREELTRRPREHETMMYFTDCNIGWVIIYDNSDREIERHNEAYISSIIMGIRKIVKNSKEFWRSTTTHSNVYVIQSSLIR